jgi:hypothetical protein
LAVGWQGQQPLHPRVTPAPATFSTITCCPSCRASNGASARTVTSEAPPVGYGKIRLRGRACDRDSPCTTINGTAHRVLRVRLRCFTSFVSRLSRWTDFRPAPGSRRG